MLARSHPCRAGQPFHRFLICFSALESAMSVPPSSHFTAASQLLVAPSLSHSLVSLLTCCDPMWLQILLLTALFSCHFHVQPPKGGGSDWPGPSSQARHLHRWLISLAADQPCSPTDSCLGSTGVVTAVVSTERAGAFAGGASTTGQERAQ